jgi:predicted DNA-binding transcriptional regulator AlpA
MEQSNGTATTSSGNLRLLNTDEVRGMLRMKRCYLSRLVNGHVKNAPPLSCVRIGRKVLFLESSVRDWIVEAEKLSCKKAR